MTAKWKTALALAAAMLLATLCWLKFFTPDLVRAGANYAAKIVCTNVLIAGRDPAEVLKVDVQAPGHPLMKFMQIDLNRDKGLVRANLFGLFGRGLAVNRPGTGCAAVPDGDIASAKKYQFAPEKIATHADDRLWPEGTQAELNAQIEKIITDDRLAGPGMRAIAVIHQSKLVAQRYASGFDEKTPLIGWSMTKSVNAILVGMQIKAGNLKLEQAGFWPAATPADGQEKIRLADLLAMRSGLQFNEDYGSVSDVTRMLYLTPDMASYVHGKPLEHPVGTYWNYSTGTSVFLSRLWQNVAGPDALSYPRGHLFAPLGMSSAFIEADARGTLVGGSYMYATAQDWARIGQFLMQNGSWNGRQLLPDDYVSMMHTVVPESDGQYGQGQVWLQGPDGDNPQGKQPGASFHLPADTFWLEGHDGQTVAIIPSLQLVVVRLGLTPHKLDYKPQALLVEILKSLS